MTEVLHESLAVDGGLPVRQTMLPYGEHTIDDQDVAKVVEALRSKRITTGPMIAEFERALADYSGAKHAVAFSSGTAALHAAAYAAELGPGDEVVTTPLTFVATANCALYQGATPVFADILPSTLNIDPADIERRITPNTKALLPVDFGGQPADLGPIMALAGRHDLVVIEDACHALGAEYKGRKWGSTSHMTVFSFHPVKHITTGEGGMVLTNESMLAERMRTFRHHGMVYPDQRAPWHYQIHDLGFNYRITDIQCALGLSQFRKLDQFVSRRDTLAQRYHEYLERSPYVTLPASDEATVHAWHIYVVMLNLDNLTVDRDRIMEALCAENVGVQLHYPLVHLQPYYRRELGYSPGLCPVAESIFPRLMTLPLFPSMSEADQDDVLHALNKVFGRYSSSDD